MTQRVFIRVYRSSARYAPKAKFSTWIFTIARNLLKGVTSDEALRIKLVMTRDGELSIKTSPLPAFGDLIRLKLAKRPIDSNNIFLFHKTTNRRVYEEAKKDVKKCDEKCAEEERKFGRTRATCFFHLSCLKTVTLLLLFIRNLHLNTHTNYVCKTYGRDSRSQEIGTSRESRDRCHLLRARIRHADVD